jgi:hypothetical protein
MQIVNVYCENTFFNRWQPLFMVSATYIVPWILEFVVLNTGTQLLQYPLFHSYPRRYNLYSQHHRHMEQCIWQKPRKFVSTNKGIFTVNEQ